MTAAAPLFSPAQAAALLDQVIYEQVLESIDLDAIYRLERSLAVLLAELPGMTAEHVPDALRALIDRALLRLPGDIRRYLRHGPFVAFDAGSRCEESRPTGPPLPYRFTAT